MADPGNNDFLLASQFWISGEYGKKRADLAWSGTRSSSRSICFNLRSDMRMKGVNLRR